MATTGKGAELGRRLAVSLPTNIRKIPIDTEFMVPSVFSRLVFLIFVQFKNYQKTSITDQDIYLGMLRP